MSVERGVRPDWLTRTLFPHDSRFVDIAGHMIHYVDEGKGPTLLMLHGDPTWSFIYRHLIGLLRAHTHVFPKAIVGSTPFLATVEAGLEGLAGKPVLLCWGDKDIAFREKERCRFERTFPRAKAIALPGAGHYVQEESPAEIAAAIRTWWSEDVECRA